MNNINTNTQMLWKIPATVCGGRQGEGQLLIGSFLNILDYILYL